jgi:hypothetical protein
LSKENRPKFLVLIQGRSLEGIPGFMVMATIHPAPINSAAATNELFALTDEQILQIEPNAQEAEVFGGERSDRMDPLREDLELLASDATVGAAEDGGRVPSNRNGSDDGLKAVAATANANAQTSSSTGAVTDTSAAAPQWLAERMNDPQHGAAARELWQGVQAARQEASAFREVFGKPEDARTAADRARKLDEIDRAYFGAAGSAPEQLSASRAQLAAQMLREDPAAFREMVFAGLRALESAGHVGSDPVAPPFRAASSGDPAPASQTAPSQTAPNPHATGQQQHQQELQRRQETQQAQDARLSAYAAFERAANEELESGVGSAIERSLQQALPNASRTENGAALKQRLSSAVRQDVEKALQGDRALGEQVARILSGQRLDNAARAHVVRLIGERAQQLVPGATRRVLADWTQTTLAAHGAHNDQEHAPARRRDGQLAASVMVDRSTAPVAQKNTAETTTQSPATRRQTPRESSRDTTNSRSPRRIDYRRISDEDILDS